MKPVHLILLLLMNAAWAATYSAYKVIGPDLTAGGIVTLRFGLAGVFLLMAWPWLPGQAPRGKDLLKSCGMGVILFVVGQRLQVYGTQLGTAGNSAVLVGVEPLVTTLAAALFLHERIGRRRLAGFALGMIGVALTSGVGRKGFQWMGLTASLVFLSSFVSEAAYSVIGKPIVLRASVMKMLAISLVAGTAINLVVDGPTTIAAAEALSARGWVLLLFLSVICTAVGYTLWFVVIRECPVNVAALTVFAQSIFGVPIAVLWLGEPFHLGQLLGSLAILTGLILGLSRQITPRSAAVCQPPLRG
jgi:drug/metabolite transporter (DMT)-like permease